MQQWSVVVPAKRLVAAKTRLTAVTDALPAGHGELVLALLGDTVDAALRSSAVRRVLVVTDEPPAAALVTGLGAETVRDEPDDGLNAALAHGARQARLRLPGGPVAALSSDLPALRPEELTAALTAAAGVPRAFVADVDGTGTTLLAVRDGELDPRFGPGSAAAHTAGGALRLDGDWPGLRRDVDTPADLHAACRLGSGPRTTGFLQASCASPG